MDDIKDKYKYFPQYNELRDLLQHANVKTGRLLKALDSYEYRSDDYRFDFIIENQRGTKFFGIPLFSNKTLLPFIDPPTYQRLDGRTISLTYNNISNFPLPDMDWEWSWDKWYLLMVNDVDAQGWLYSLMIFNSTHWKGKYRFGNFIRRRIWVRMRHKITTEGPKQA